MWCGLARTQLVSVYACSGVGWGVALHCVECACSQERMPNTVCWSNGNLFRCITLLAVTHLEKAGIVRVARAEKNVDDCAACVDSEYVGWLVGWLV